MDLIQKIKRIEQYVVENFEELDLDDPIEEGYWEEYQEIPGASPNEIESFEKKFNIKLPKDRVIGQNVLMKTALQLDK